MKRINPVLWLPSVLLMITVLFSACSESTQCNHNYTSKITTEASCIYDGVKTFTCTKCKDSYSEAIAATGKHNYISKVTTAATCVQSGVKTFTCSVCKDSYTEEIPATGKHDYIAEVTTEATCTQDGIKAFTCSVCDDSYTETILAEHKWIDASCTEPKTCSVCEITDGEALGHEVQNGTCVRCGEKITVILYEDNSVKITFKKAEKYRYSNDEVELYFYVENKTEKTLLIQADAVSLNGYCFCDLIMSDPVAANSIGTIELGVRNFDFDLVNIDNIYSIGGQFRIIDDATRKSYDALFTNIQLNGNGIGSRPSDFTCDYFLYTDNNCEIYYKSIEEYPYSDDQAELYFYIVNKTEKTLLIQADAISINGYSFSKLVMSDPVLPDTIGTINLTVRNFDFDLIDMNNITKIGGQFRIIDDATRKSYDAIFSQ